jgi:hypothetical protein
VSETCKKWWKSKTIWFNIGVASLAALEASFSLFQPLIVGDVYAYALTLLTIGNAILRVITTQGLES